MVSVEPNPAAETVESEDYINWLQWMKEELQAAIDNGDFTGPQGPQGTQGDPGETPVKGVDYYTQEEKQEMVAAVLAALPNWEGGSY